MVLNSINNPPPRTGCAIAREVTIILVGKSCAASHYIIMAVAVGGGGGRTAAAGKPYYTDVILHSTSVRVLRPSQFDGRVIRARKSSLSFQMKFLLENRRGEADIMRR